MVTIGIDTHKATLAVRAIDPTGRETGARTFPNDRQGHVGILRWAQAHGSERRFGISVLPGLTRMPTSLPHTTATP